LVGIPVDEAKDKGSYYTTIVIIMWRKGKNGKAEVPPYPACVYCEGKGYLKLDRNLW
jgi:hypothetical protein